MRSKWIEVDRDDLTLTYLWGKDAGTYKDEEELFDQQHVLLKAIHSMIRDNVVLQQPFELGPLAVRFKDSQVDIFWDEEAKRNDGIPYTRCAIDGTMLEDTLLETMEAWSNAFGPKRLQALVAKELKKAKKPKQAKKDKKDNKVKTTKKRTTYRD